MNHDDKNFADIDLFADELDDRMNAAAVAGTVSSTTCLSSASSFGTSCAACACTTSTLCSAGAATAAN
ncbi:hypothetical protein ACFJIW_19395 [Tahibacter sp. UC22_41]|jgi:hypothetical protein|uniref:hypothetical protein n=1 Tax=Tahibacter sp. UC22_41 TaxID=3350178 RepID=UPI002BF98F6D|nr:hypothetical protein [Tahibacter sp.]